MRDQQLPAEQRNHRRQYSIPAAQSSQRSRAQAADADALKATKQAEAARNQLAEETLRLQRSVAQMQAARDVAQLEYEIAEKSLTAVQTRIDAGTATLHDLGTPAIKPANASSPFRT